MTVGTLPTQQQPLDDLEELLTGPPRLNSDYQQKGLQATIALRKEKVP